MPRRWLPFLALAAAAVAGFACSTNPATGRRQLMLISSDQEIALGKQAVPGVLAEFGALENAALAGWVKTIGQDLAKTTERTELPYTFTVLDSPVVNAFALPGGPTFVTRGLVAYANDEAELAGVVGHEVGHVVARHGAEQASRAQALGGLLVLGSIASERVAQWGGVLGAGAQLLLLQNSRDAEREADRLGVRYAARAGFDPAGVSRYMGVLDRLNKTTQSPLPNWLSTHPDPGERAQVTARLAAEVPPVADPRVGRDTLLRYVDGLVFGDDPREGFQKGQTFHHPQMKFRFDLPAGWQTVNTKQAVIGVDSREKPTSQIQLTVAPQGEGAPREPAAYAQFLAGKNPDARFAGAAGNLNGYDAWLGQVVVPQQDGSAQQILAAFIDQKGTLLQFLGAGADLAAVERVMKSFRPENDAAILGVKPVLVDVVEVRRGGTLGAFCAERKDLGAPCAQIAALNHLVEEARLEPGQSLKVPIRQSAVYP